MALKKDEYRVTLTYNEKTGLVCNETWKDKHGNLVRPNGPYQTRWDDEGRKIAELYSVEFFDPDGTGSHPSCINFDPETGNITREIYIDVSDNLHRLNGPAVVHYDRDTGEVVAQHFYFQGKRVDEEGNHLEQYVDPFFNGNDPLDLDP